MTSYELRSFRGPDELAHSTATEWLQELATPTHPAPAPVALSGGRIARVFFFSVTALARARGSRLDNVHFFWSDERCVPPDSVESNFQLARQELLEPLGIPADRIHRIRGEEPPAEAARLAQEELRRVASEGPDGQPVFDLVFLGMGEDGHVASLFPGEPQQVWESKAVFRAVTASKPPAQRITLGYPALAAARQVWVLASGPGKEGALRQSLAPGGRTPLAKVLQSRASGTRIYTDISL